MPIAVFYRARRDDVVDSRRADLGLPRAGAFGVKPPAGELGAVEQEAVALVGDERGLDVVGRLGAVRDQFRRGGIDGTSIVLIDVLLVDPVRELMAALVERRSRGALRRRSAWERSSSKPRRAPSLPRIRRGRPAQQPRTRPATGVSALVPCPLLLPCLQSSRRCNILSNMLLHPTGRAAS